MIKRYWISASYTLVLVAAVLWSGSFLPLVNLPLWGLVLYNDVTQP